MKTTADLVTQFRSMFRRKKSDATVASIENPWIVLAIGNPGDQYARSRHNVAWWFADAIRERHKSNKLIDEGPARIAHLKVADQNIIIAYPKTYVNRSGIAARALIQKYNIAIDRLLVVSDDINLPPGRIRIRRHGSAGGHNGLQSIIDTLNENQFPRIRIGVGKQSGDESQIDHVLGEPDPEELEMIENAVARTADAFNVIIAEGIGPAMNRFNQKG